MDADEFKKVLNKKFGLCPKGNPDETVSDELLRANQLLANQATGERARYMTFVDETFPTVVGVEFIYQALDGVEDDAFNMKCCYNLKKKFDEIADSKTNFETNAEKRTKIKTELGDKISNTQRQLSDIMSIAQNHDRLKVSGLPRSECKDIVRKISESLDAIKKGVKNMKEKWIEWKRSKKAGYIKYIEEANFELLPTATKHALSLDVTPLSVLFFVVEEDLKQSSKELTQEKFSSDADVYLGTLDRLIPRLLVMVVSNCLVSMKLNSTAMLKIAEKHLNLKGDDDKNSLLILGECLRHSRCIFVHELKPNEGEGDIEKFEENARCIGEILEPYFTVSSDQDGNPLKQTLADIFPGMEKFAVDVPEAILSGHTQLKKLMKENEQLKKQKLPAANKSSALGHKETQVLPQPTWPDSEREKDQRLVNKEPLMAGRDELLAPKTRGKDELEVLGTEPPALPVEQGPPDTDKKNFQPFFPSSPSTTSQIPVEVEETPSDLKVTEAGLEPDDHPCT